MLSQHSSSTSSPEHLTSVSAVSSFSIALDSQNSPAYLSSLYYMPPLKTTPLHPLIGGTTQTLTTLLAQQPRLTTQSIISQPSFIQHIKPAHLCPTPETTLMCVESLLGLLSSYYSNEEYMRKKPILRDGWNNLQSVLNEKERILINKKLPTDIYYQIIDSHPLDSPDISTSSNSDSSLPAPSPVNLDTRKRLRPIKGKNSQGTRKSTTQTQSSSSSSVRESSSDEPFATSSEDLSDFEVDDGDKVPIDEELIVDTSGGTFPQYHLPDPHGFSFDTEHSDAELHQHLSNIVLYITRISPSIIIPGYRHILQSVLSSGREFLIDSLETILKSNLAQPFGSSLCSFISEMKVLSNGSDIDKLYYQLSTILCSAVISESSCERGLGKAKSISTKTRSNLRTEVLNAILLAS